MRASSGLAAVGLALAVLASPAAAATPLDPTGSHTVQLVHGFWSLVADVTGPGQGPQTPHPAPQVIPQRRRLKSRSGSTT